jgi:N-acyl homoserine lactone hydrolase
VKMYLLYYGVTYVDKGLVLTEGKDLGKVIPTPIWGALIDTGSERVLVDTGMNPVHISDPDATFRGTDLSGIIKPVLHDEDLASSRIKSCGVMPEQIDYVINTHFHFDHCGGNLFFPQADFVVQKEHYEWALQSEQCPKRDFNLPGTKWKLVEGPCTLLPGIELLPTPGHVPGHQSVVVYLEQTGPVIITGDAIFLEETMEDNAPVTAFDADLYHESIMKLCELQKKIKGQIFIAHEQEKWDQWKHAPEWYD